MALSARAVVEVPCCARGTVPATASPPEEASSLFPSPRAECWPGVRVSPFSPLCGSWCRAPHAVRVNSYRPVLCFCPFPHVHCRPRRFLYTFCHCGSRGIRDFICMRDRAPLLEPGGGLEGGPVGGLCCSRCVCSVCASSADSRGAGGALAPSLASLFLKLFLSLSPGVKPKIR